MGKRLDLHKKLKEVLGSNSVFFQPPSTVKMSYPCIIYKIDASSEKFADNILYHNMRRYLVTIVDQDPDSNIPNKLLDFRYCSFVNHITVDNLNHFIYSLYF